jgi:hypothetical protein
MNRLGCCSDDARRNRVRVLLVLEVLCLLRVLLPPARVLPHLSTERSALSRIPSSGRPPEAVTARYRTRPQTLR